jgi:hypothetical protein
MTQKNATTQTIAVPTITGIHPRFFFSERTGLGADGKEIVGTKTP